MKHKTRGALMLGWLLLTCSGCPNLGKYNYGPAYDEDPAYLSVPDPRELSADDSESESSSPGVDP